jgi:protoporphyrinogen/coproporphyrinogen III oxidase
MSAVERPVAILGGGLAGLTAATYLRRHGIPVRVYEAGKQLAGLARSERDADGFTYDCGAHFITNRLAAAVGLSAACRHMPRYGETVWHRGRGYSYPFGLMRSVRYMASAVAAKVGGVFAGKAVTAADHYRGQYGRKLADEIALPLTAAWSGATGEELAASVGEKFATSLPRTMMLKAAARLTRRTVAIGYSGTVPESPHVWHVYPEGGIGTVCERLADEVRDAVRTESPVEAILVENERAVGVRVNGKDVPARAVVSTAPVHALAKLVRGTDRLAYLARFRYRAMVFVNMRFDGPSGLPDVVTWTPGADIPFFRLSDIGMGLPWLVPVGKTQVTCDIGCRVGDDTWTASDESLGELCRAALDRMVPGLAKRFLGCRVMRTPLAYPVYLVEYEADRRRFEAGTGVAGLYSIGRNGEFAHILMEDVFWRTRRKIVDLVDGADGRTATDSGVNSLIGRTS